MPQNVCTNADKKLWFVRGLNIKLQTLLTIYATTSYNEIISIAISLEYKNHLQKEAKKRNKMLEGSSGDSA